MILDYPRLETDRLLLRGWSNNDFNAYAALVADPEVARWTNPDGVPLNREQAWRNMAMIAGHWALRGYGLFAVEEKTGGRVVGRIGPWYPEGWPGIELGWTLISDARGRGYAVEAGRACLEWMFTVLDLPRVISVIEPANAPSIAVAKRLGERFLNAATVKGRACHIYGIDRH